MPDANDAALTQATEALARLTGTREASLLLAVSGGPDSMALLDWLGRGWQGAVSAATVDHGLRPESAGEAAMVARYCDSAGMAHATLHPAVPITGSLQSAARTARYALLQAHADAIGAQFIVTAHHADDQLETMLMRLARGGGVDGLAGIRARVGRVVRPLLGFRKADLLGHCQRAGIAFVEDPSNANRDFDRVRMREALAGFDAIDPLQAARSASALAQAAEALDWVAAREADHAIIIDETGVRLASSAFPPALLRRLVLLCIDKVQPGLSVRGPALDRLIETLQSGSQAMIGDVLCGQSRTDPGWHFRPAPPRHAATGKRAAE